MSMYQTYADYLLNEKSINEENNIKDLNQKENLKNSVRRVSDINLIEKLDIVDKTKMWLKKNRGISFYFNNSTILKTEIARMFLKYAELKNEVSPNEALEEVSDEIDHNVLLTSCLTCNCKKKDGAQSKYDLLTYATRGAEYLETLGFDERYCRVNRQLNRYSKEEPREPEADVLELIDNFGGMILDRPEREGFTPKQAVEKLEENLTNKRNRYLSVFKKYIIDVDKLNIEDSKKPIFLELKNMCENDGTRDIINNKLGYFEDSVDKTFQDKLIADNENYLNRNENLSKADSTRGIFPENVRRRN